MTATVRIGTRDSRLALWQAETVQKLLKANGINSELVHIKSEGDLKRDQPIDQMGMTGVFTKKLDEALLNEEVDMAVHSLKDVPTLPAEGLHQGAVLKRSSYSDVLITQVAPAFLDDASFSAAIASGSMRRKAQWLNKYPHHQLTGLRGNVDSRLKKLTTEKLDGIILSMAGIERLGLQPEHVLRLNWMVPAPAQGVVSVFCRTNDALCRNMLALINDSTTEMTSHVERQLLRTLEGGCTAPIGALASISGKSISLKACLLNLSGTKKVELSKEVSLDHFHDLGEKLANEILKKGGDKLIKEIRKGE